MTSFSVMMMYIHALLLLVQVYGRGDSSDDDLIVNTNKGRVKGMRFNLPQPINEAVHAYLGIPFAKPPLGHLRFRHPQPADQWEGVHDASQLPNTCYQSPNRFFGDFSGSAMWDPPTALSEDCLYLNVWVPATHPPISNAAVMVWIHGGGFTSGTPTLDIYDGKILAAANDVIVVSIAYRVGALGFLNLNTADAPGNAGLFDQLMGLEWVQQNIRNFGGDPQSVTLFGESAGGVSVSFHLVSPLSKDHFQRAIMQSGSANMGWATITPYEGKRRSLALAHDYLHCRDGDLDEVLQCLRSTAPEDIIEQQSAMSLSFLPVIDGQFLTEPPDNTLRSRTFKKCPVLMGSNLNEGAYFLLYELHEFLTLENQTMDRDQFLTSMNRLFHTYPHYPHTANPVIMDAIVFQYTNWSNPDDTPSNIASLDQAFGDFQFTCNVNYFARAYASAGEDVYMYYLTHRYSITPWPEWTGVMHGDELMFLFGLPLREKDYTSDEREISEQIMQYWTNFAKTGDPNPRTGAVRNLHHWPHYTPDGQEYLELNSQLLSGSDQSLSVGRGPRIKECAFWQEYLPGLRNQTACVAADSGSSWLNQCTLTQLLVVGAAVLTWCIHTEP